MQSDPLHDVVVVGASAGGLDALETLVAGLPRDFPAAVLVAVHSHPTSRHLAAILADKAAMPAAFPMHGEPLAPGRIYVAPPDMQLVVRLGHVEVVRGPRENGHRPSVDVLFRSAAKAYGPRVIGVILSGHHDCGTAGMLSIKARHGVAVAQDPADARVPEMPQSAIDHVAIDHVVPSADMARLLGELVRTPASIGAATLPEEVLEVEGETTGVGTGLACPLCSGGMTESDPGNLHVFRCHVGHAFTLDALARLQEDAIERALWAAVRSLEDGANVSRRLAADSKGELHERFDDRARVQSRDADVIRELLIGAKPKDD